MSVPTAGDSERDVPQTVSRATIANIVRHRAEEIFEMVRDRLADSPLAAEPRARGVFSGGGAPPHRAGATPPPVFHPAGRDGPPPRFRPPPPAGHSAPFPGAPQPL